MQIVVTNECFLNQDHIKELKRLGDLKIYDSTNDEELPHRIKDAEIVLGDCYLTKFDKKLFESSKKLKLVQINSTGYSGVDIDSAKKHKISVGNVPGFATDSVAELAITLMLVAGRKILHAHEELMKNPFEVDPGNKEHGKYLGYNFKGKVLGVVGLGNIGMRVAEIGRAMGMEVIGWNRTKKSVKDIDFQTIDKVFKNSDVVIVSLAFSQELAGFVNKKLIDSMKGTAILVSIGMPKIIDENALLNALKNNKIFGAAVDVPNLKNKELLEHRNFVSLPHIGWYTQESLNNIGDIILENVKSFVKGNPKNIVSK